MGLGCSLRIFIGRIFRNKHPLLSLRGQRGCKGQGGCLFLNTRSTMSICPYPEWSRFVVSLDSIRPDTARGVDVESGLLTPRSADMNNPLRTPFRNGCVGTRAGTHTLDCFLIDRCILRLCCLHPVSSPYCQLVC